MFVDFFFLLYNFRPFGIFFSVLLFWDDPSDFVAFRPRKHSIIYSDLCLVMYAFLFPLKFFILCEKASIFDQFVRLLLRFLITAE